MSNKMDSMRLEYTLRSLGAVWYNLRLPETHYLPEALSENEKIVGIVYGKYTRTNAFGGTEGSVTVGRGLIVATDRRVLLIDKKPLFVMCDEIKYAVISAIAYSRIAIAGTITLHTAEGDIEIRTFNSKCARKFVDAVEAVTFRNKTKAIS